MMGDFESFIVGAYESTNFGRDGLLVSVSVAMDGAAAWRIYDGRHEACGEAANAAAAYMETEALRATWWTNHAPPVQPYPDVVNPCRVYWGSHGCCLERGHDGEHRCDCTWDWEGRLRAHSDDVPDDHEDSGNVGRAPYYGLDTHFYGEDS